MSNSSTVIATPSVNRDCLQEYLRKQVPGVSLEVHFSRPLADAQKFSLSPGFAETGPSKSRFAVFRSTGDLDLSECGERQFFCQLENEGIVVYAEGCVVNPEQVKANKRYSVTFTVYVGGQAKCLACKGKMGGIARYLKSVLAQFRQDLMEREAIKGQFQAEMADVDLATLRGKAWDMAVSYGDPEVDEAVEKASLLDAFYAARTVAGGGANAPGFSYA